MRIFSKQNLSYGVKSGLTVLVSVLIIFAVAQAGAITPPSGTPSAKFYTISEIYNFITNNTAATEGSHSFAFSDNLEGTGRTLTEIYNSLANLISADKVKSGTTYLNVAGTLVPSGGTAATADVLSAKTFFGDSQTDWSPKTGAMANNGSFGLTCGASDQAVAAGYYSGGNLAGDADLAAGNIKSGTDIFGVAGSLVAAPAYGDNNPTKVLNTASNPGTYDVATCTSGYNTLNLSVGTVKSGTTFGVGLIGEYPSDTYPLSGGAGTDAIAGNILSGFDAWNKTGAHITGAMPTRTLSDNSSTVSAGYYDATTLSAVDSDLISNNILSGKTIFGVAGDSNVVNTSSGDATAGNILFGKIAWVDGAAVTGNIPTQTLSAANETVSAGYYNATTLSAADTDLAEGNIKSGTTIFGILGTLVSYLFGDNDASKVLTTAAGTGTYNAANLSVGTVKSGTAFGVSLTGEYPSATYTLPSADATADLSSSGGNISSSNGAVEWWQSDGARQTATLDFPTLSNVCSTDTSNNSAGTLAVSASSIGAGNTYCGTAGTLLANLYNGSATSGDYPQSVGGVDDYNNGGTMPSDSYSSSWTACNVGNSYCNTSDATNADKKDNGTNLVWSKWLDSGTAHTWFWANNCQYPNGLPGDDGVCGANGEVACKCVKLASSKTGCENLGSGWRLPSQKELMQVYIDGSWGNLSSAGNYYWSATTRSDNTQDAWYTYLYFGLTYTYTKAATIQVRCVR